MMYDYRLIYNYASNAVRLELPDGMAAVTSGKITAKDTGGTELLAATAVTVPTATTLSVAAEEGDDTITVAGGTWEPGDRLLIADSDAGAPEIVEVESYNSSTKVITLRADLEHDHSSAAAVSARWVTYTLNTTTVATWPDLLEGKLIFDTWSSGAPAIDRTFIVSKKAFELSGLGARFRRSYPHYFRAIDGDEAFDDFVEDAVDELDSRFGRYGKHLRASASERDVSRLIMAQIALLIAERQGAGWDDERRTSGDSVERQFMLIRETRQWYDADEDDIEDEGEAELQMRPLPGRGWV